MRYRSNEWPLRFAKKCALVRMAAECSFYSQSTSINWQGKNLPTTGPECQSLGRSIVEAIGRVLSIVWDVAASSAHSLVLYFIEPAHHVSCMHAQQPSKCRRARARAHTHLLMPLAALCLPKKTSKSCTQMCIDLSK